MMAEIGQWRKRDLLCPVGAVIDLESFRNAHD
jgi:hypothetical protein